MCSLPRPEVIRCYHDPSFHPPLPAMVLRWDADTPSLADGVWHLPENVVVKGPAPKYFGIVIQRKGPNSFRVRCLWDNLAMTWNIVTRSQIMASSLSTVLEALGTDLWYLLNQPVDAELVKAA